MISKKLYKNLLFFKFNIDKQLLHCHFIYTYSFNFCLGILFKLVISLRFTTIMSTLDLLNFIFRMNKCFMIPRKKCKSKFVTYIESAFFLFIPKSGPRRRLCYRSLGSPRGQWGQTRETSDKGLIFSILFLMSEYSIVG